MTKQTKSVTQAQGVEVTPNQLLQQAIESNLDLDKLEKFMNLQERWEKKEAEKAFHDAFAKWQKIKPPLIKQTNVSAQTKKGLLSYSFASLPYIQKTVDPVLSKCGFSYWWSQSQEGARIKVTCHLSHIKGHTETTTLEAGPDETGAKNSVQAIGSTVQYLRRYTFTSITGLSADQDDDANSVKPTKEEIHEMQLHELESLYIEVGDLVEPEIKKRLGDIIEKRETSAYTKAIRSLKSVVPKQEDRKKKTTK